MALRPERARGGDLEAAALSHTGRTREANEDTYVLDIERRRFAVVDGMGGHQAGEVAAEMAAAELAEPGSLSTAFRTANQRIVTLSEREPERAGMGCVATAVDVGTDYVQLVHAGDTRAVLAAALECTQLTVDHVSDGAVSRDLGTRYRPDDRWFDEIHDTFEPGDLLLLCSDGLTDVVEAREVRAELERARKEGERPDQVAIRLVRLALARDTQDNVTVVVVRRFRPRRWPRVVVIGVGLVVAFVAGWWARGAWG